MMRPEISSSLRFGEDPARAGAAQPPPAPLHGPPNFAGAAASLADGDVVPGSLSVREDKQQRTISPLGTAARTPNPLQRIDELVLALALVNAENNALRRQLAELRTERDTWRAEVLAG